MLTKDKYDAMLNLSEIPTQMAIIDQALQSEDEAKIQKAAELFGLERIILNCNCPKNYKRLPFLVKKYQFNCAHPIDDEGNTILHLLLRYSYTTYITWPSLEYDLYKVFLELLTLLPDINTKTKLGRTLLHEAYGARQQKIVDLLKEKGADPNIKDNNGFTPVKFWPWKESEENSLEFQRIIAASG